MNRFSGGRSAPAGRPGQADDNADARPGFGMTTALQHRAAQLVP